MVMNEIKKTEECVDIYIYCGCDRHEGWEYDETKVRTNETDEEWRKICALAGRKPYTREVRE